MEKRKTPWKSFWVIFPILSILPIGILTGYASWSLSEDMEKLRQRERHAVDLQREEVVRALERPASDVCWFAGQNELANLLLPSLSDQRQELVEELEIFALNTRIYDQIRYIDEAGRERIRIDFNHGNVTVVPDAQLQDKSKRYYVQYALRLQGGEIYVSPLDLNVEHNEVEIPYKPTIRVATRVTDGTGALRGFVVVNYMATLMFRRVVSVATVSPGYPMMMNGDGYWFLAPPKSSAWGFMIPDLLQERMGVRFPDVWEHMSRNRRGTVRSKAGLFTYQVYYPLYEISDCVGYTGKSLLAEREWGYRWYLASFVPQSVLAVLQRKAIVSALVIGLPMLILLGVGTRAMTVLVQERRRHREHLEALARSDALTGLANRATFDDRLTEESIRARRYSRRFAVLYLDLDGFKAINDSQGHEAGDRVLVDVARVLSTSCRAVDLPARYGGDEFVILLSEVGDRAAALGVAEKILTRVRALSWDESIVGVSMGLALWPDDVAESDEATTVVHLADAAMYAAKTSGKNRICLARDLATGKAWGGHE